MNSCSLLLSLAHPCSLLLTLALSCSLLLALADLSVFPISLIFHKPTEPTNRLQGEVLSEPVSVLSSAIMTVNIRWFDCALVCRSIRFPLQIAASLSLYLSLLYIHINIYIHMFQNLICIMNILLIFFQYHTHIRGPLSSHITSNI